MKCYNCGKTSKGNMPTAKIDGEERPYCADCYWKLEKEYKLKKTCEDCAHFNDEHCKKTDVALVPVTIGYNNYFVQAENCNYFNADKEVFLQEAKKLEAESQFEEAALLYEKLDMPEQAEASRKNIKAIAQQPVNINTQVKNLVKKGKTLSYFCCHCGAPLKIGAKAPQVQKNCPRCGGDLEVINLGKLIQQNSS